MLSGNSFFVPDYQRAYSWEKGDDSDKPLKQVNTFIADLKQHIDSGTESPYYFGHFLFEKENIEGNRFGIIDGQQRLTTIVIFLVVLYRQMKPSHDLKRDYGFEFDTVTSDNHVFNIFVIENNRIAENQCDTESADRIVATCKYFEEVVEALSECRRKKMLETVLMSSCTTHVVEDKSESIQMFIFQNSRGKKPSNLEIIKAQFLFNIHLYADTIEKEKIVRRIDSKFGEIYKTINSFSKEYKIREDEVLNYTLRIFFKSLYESNAISRINSELSKRKKKSICFIDQFTNSIYSNCVALKRFFCVDNKNEDRLLAFHSLASLGDIGFALPFILTGYKRELEIDELSKLCSSLESLLVRHRVIGTRAYMNSRLNEKFREFVEEKCDTESVLNQVDSLKTNTTYWWSHWNDIKFEEAISGPVNHRIARFLLWKYEISLRSPKKGHGPLGFNVVSPTIEHISPRTAPEDSQKSGYDRYDEEFKNNFLNCLGNFLLLSKQHNCAIGNKSFADKRASYDDPNALAQHREVLQMSEREKVWTKKEIGNRRTKIVKFIMSNF